MKHILVMGAGKSSTSLIEYLLTNASAENWHVHVADVQHQAAEKKIAGHPEGNGLWH